MTHIMRIDEMISLDEGKWLNKDFHDEYAREIMASGVTGKDLLFEDGQKVPENVVKSGTVDFDKALDDCRKRFGEWEKLPEDEREAKHFRRMSQKITPVKAVCNVVASARMFGAEHDFTLGYLDALVRYQGFSKDEVAGIFTNKDR